MNSEEILVDESPNLYQTYYQKKTIAPSTQKMLLFKSRFIIARQKLLLISLFLCLHRVIRIVEK